MGDDVMPDDVTGRPATVGKMLRRGMLKRCPRCGGGQLYRGWFRMHERCPTCGMRFEREPGFFVGAYLINFAITEGLLFLAVMAFVLVAANDGDRGLTVPLVVGLVVAVVAPILFYPFARTIWSAIDLSMSPLELDEIVGASEFVEQRRVDGDGDAGGESPRDGPEGSLP